MCAAKTCRLNTCSTPCACAGGLACSISPASTGLSINRIGPALEQAQRLGLLQRSGNHVQPTERGFDFLNDLQALFLPRAIKHIA